MKAPKPVQTTYIDTYSWNGTSFTLLLWASKFYLFLMAQTWFHIQLLWHQYLKKYELKFSHSHLSLLLHAWFPHFPHNRVPKSYQYLVQEDQTRFFSFSAHVCTSGNKISVTLLLTDPQNVGYCNAIPTAILGKMDSCNSFCLGK